MRQGFIAAAFVAAGLIASTPAFAAGAPKFAVVDINQVVTKSHRFQQGNAEIQAMRGKLQGQFDEKNNKYKTLKDQLDKADAKSADYKKLSDQVSDARDDAQQFLNDSQEQLNQYNQQLRQSVADEFQKVLSIYAKSKGYDMVFMKGSGAAYASDSYDVSTEMLQALDRDWDQLQKNAPAPTAAPAASTKH
jgi:Skp family chaperone for outer membrane proteins